MIYNKEYIDMSLVQCQYKEEQGFIHISDEYTNNILKLSGYDEIDDSDFKTMCINNILELHLYEYALKSAPNAYRYARDILKGRFELGEVTIANDSYLSLMYASEVLKDRFELGEPVIAKNYKDSFAYAHYILKGRFELGEPSIAVDSFYSYYYARDVLKGRFELGETIITDDGFLRSNILN